MAASFAWPFRGSWKKSWAVGLPVVLFSPLLFIPLLGYAVEATRAAQNGDAGPPAWRFNDRLIKEGALVFAAVMITWVPFAFLASPIASGLYSIHVWPTSDVAMARFESAVLATLIVALPAGLAALLWLPHATARFAASGKTRDLFDLGASLRSLRSDFGTWNLAIAAIVTAWAIGLACASLLCVGLVPGLYYAILVSAHASATLQTRQAEGRTETKAHDSSAR